MLDSSAEGQVSLQPLPFEDLLTSMAMVSRHGYVAGQQIAKRLDVLGNLQSGCLGVSWWFVRVFLVAGGAWAMAAAQTGSLDYMSDSIEVDLPMTPARRALAGSVDMLGAFVGALCFGSLADTRGRKFSLLIAFALTHSVGALCAASPNLEVLTLCRLVLGLGLGGQMPTICTLMMELAPTNIRGRVLVYLDAFWPLGTICMALVCREAAPVIGWQAVFALSGGALLYLPLLYYCVPESPKWLASAGKFDEAVRVLRAIEHKSSVFHSEDADDAILRPPHTEHDNLNTLNINSSAKHVILQMHKPSFFALVATRVRLLLQYPYLARTLLLWFVWTGLAISFSAMWSHLHEILASQVLVPTDKELLIYGVLVAQLLGNLSACALIDRIGRKLTIAGFLVFVCLASLMEACQSSTSSFMLILSSCLSNFAFFGALGCLYTYTPELYPTSIRVIGIGYAWGISRLGAFAGPYLALWMGHTLRLANSAIVAVFSGLALCVAVTMLLFGIETAGYDAERAARRSSGVASTTDQRHDDDLSNSAMLAYHKHPADDGDDETAAPVAASYPTHFI